MDIKNLKENWSKLIRHLESQDYSRSEISLCEKTIKKILESPDIHARLSYSEYYEHSMKVGQLHLNEPKPFATVMGKGSKPRTLYLLPKAVAHLTAYMKEYHPEGRQERYLFYSRNHNAYGKLTQPAIDKRLKLYAQRAHEKCPEVPLNLHAHQFRHAKSSHWLEDGMNIVQVSLLMGHAHIQTTMGYLDITTEQESKALATLEDENEAKLSKKWKGRESSLLALCGLQ